MDNRYYQMVRRAQERLPKDKTKWTREDYLNSCLKMVVDMAIKYANITGADTEELICEGNAGLCRAWDKYRPDSKAKFSSVAFFWIKAFILNNIAKNTPQREILSLERDVDADFDVIDDWDPEDETTKSQFLEGLTEEESDIIKRYYAIGCDKQTLTKILEDYPQYQSTRGLLKVIGDAFDKIRANATKYQLDTSKFTL